ncbi:MAG TPA: helicase HerA-like domain-containing protein [Solirubrobacteraceae bacterium]|nr:helicase HerA-like domain-containing protein [Solirubrobacteraceae bacterium]
MRLLRSPRLMLILFVVLLAAPAWVTTAVLGAAAVAAAVRGLRGLAARERSRRPVPGQEVLLGTAGGGRRISLDERELSAHGLILGASGSGKTTALLTILEQQIRRGLPVVAIDLKGSPTFTAQLAQAAAAAGRPFKLWTPDGPGFWNPLQHGNATEGKDKLIASEHFSEPHYQRAAERYVQMLLRVLGHLHPGTPATLDEVVGLMDPKRLPGLLRQLPQDLADRVQDYRQGLTSDQLSAIRGLQTRLAVITESAAGGYLKPHGAETVDLRAALEGPEVVLFSLNSSRYGKFAAQLGTLVVQDLISASGQRLEAQRSGDAPGLAVVAIDEFSAIGGEHVVALFARGREAGIGVLVATQEMADLAHAGRGVRDQVVGSTAFKLILRQEVPDSARMVAELAGTERVWEETRQIGGGVIFPGAAGRGTRRQVERFIIDPNQVKTLRTGEAVLISRLGNRPPQVIWVTPMASAAPQPKPAADDRDRAGPTVAPPPRPHGRGADVRPESARAKRAALSGRTPRSRYPDPGVTR